MRPAPLPGALSDARDELDEATGLISHAIDAADNDAIDLELTASTPAERGQARAARAQVEALEELLNQAEALHSAAEHAHTYLDETGGIHDARIEALTEITAK